MVSFTHFVNLHQTGYHLCKFTIVQMIWYKIIKCLKLRIKNFPHFQELLTAR